MSASFRSHFKSSTHDKPTASSQRKQSSRVPTKPSSTDSQQEKPAQHVSKLAKRASRTISSTERAQSDTSRTAKTPALTTSAHNPLAAPLKASVALPSETPTAAASLLTSTRNTSLPKPSVMRTPSLVSGSSASTFDSPRSTGLRRKPSTIDKYAAQKRAETPVIEADRATMHSRSDGYQEAFDDSVFGISMPPPKVNNTGTTYPPANKAQLVQDMYGGERPSTRGITPPFPVRPVYAQSSTPSTRYTDSPFSHVPTPSSASSYSPSVFATTGSTPQLPQASPTRSGPSTNIRAGSKKDPSRLGLPPVRESSTSSSNSTLKPSVSNVASAKTEVPRKAPSAPPTETSSVRRKPVPVRKSSQNDQKASSKSALARQPVQVPPELAHLNVDPPAAAGTQKPLPPLRPSRDNTPSMDFTRAPPIVQSDLPRLYTTYHKRTPSQETPLSATSPSLRSRLGFSSRASSRQESPRIDSAISPPPSTRNLARGPTPDIAPSEGHRLLRKDSPAVGPAPSPSKSPRFNFFSRKVKETTKPEKPKRESRKGPAAGTGHEGYGRFGFRGRSGSTTSNTSGRSPSADSTASSVARPTTSRNDSLARKDGSDLDDFLRERLTPVVLRGSGGTLSNQASVSDMQSASILDSSSSPSLASLIQPQLLPSAMVGNRAMSPAKRPFLGFRKPSDSSEDDVTARYPTLAARRSFNKLQADGETPLRMPPPIDTSMPAKTNSIHSYDADTSAWPQTDSTLPGAEDVFDGKEGMWLRPAQLEAPEKPSRKWNFFQRAHSSPRKGKERAVDAGFVAQISPKVAVNRGRAHYALLDPVESVGLEEVERIMQENETSADESVFEEHLPPKIVPYERRHTGLLPSPPKPDFSEESSFRAKPTPPRIMVRQDSSESPELLRAQAAVTQEAPNVVRIARSPSVPQANSPAAQQQLTPDIPQGSLSTPEMPQGSDSPRQPRLSPVGRIPRVVSRRDRDVKLPETSFSRPFANAQPRPTVKPPGTLYNQIRELASPIESGSQPVSSTSERSAEPKSSVNTDPQSVSTNRTSIDIHASHDFMTFPPRKNSEHSWSSSSGNLSWMASLLNQPPQQDDVWQEYNDLLDDVMPTPVSAGSSLGAPFQYSSMMYGTNGAPVPAPLSYPAAPTRYQMQALPLPPRSSNDANVLSVPQQIARFMQPSTSPLATPNTLANFVDSYADRSIASVSSQNRESSPKDKRSSIPTPRCSVSSSRYSRASGHSRSASLPEANVRNSQASLTPSARFNRDTKLLDDIAEHEEQSSSSNLRYGALLTSKWLSFGRVLFSPAHHEMRLSDDPRVLVVDGLGSDWSYYVAMSYPNAAVYNLAPAGIGRSSPMLPSANGTAFAKHHNINHPSISAPFPFPKGFFTAVVFRFPVATTDQAYHACVYECKRVLRPGGHLEVAVLDLDLINMGSRVRKAVRGLKTRMQERDESVSLRNMSDSLVRLIGRRGFDQVQRCVVGVPAAGRIPRSQDVSSRSSHDSANRPVWQREDHSGKEKEFSFTDLLEDARSSQIGPGRSNDEGITKMVAKVGRWWYTSCYEAPLLRTDRSIWNDSALLRECEKQGTSFRLLICYAQKPIQTRRRTVSV